jgi:UDP-3-O-[3-hydroxymyristoyl] glucosamine N-acyltransferase
MGCCAVGGYCEIGEDSVIYGNSTLKNRIRIGKNCLIGMGSVVHHDIRDNMEITGSPAISLEKAAKNRIIEIKLRNLLKQMKF